MNNTITHLAKNNRIIISLDCESDYVLCKNKLPEFLNNYGLVLSEREIYETGAVPESLRIKKLLDQMKYHCGDKEIFNEIEILENYYRAFDVVNSDLMELCKIDITNILYSETIDLKVMWNVINKLKEYTNLPFKVLDLPCETQLEKNIIKIQRIIKKWYTGEFTISEQKTKRYKDLKAEGIIPIQYIQQRCGNQLKDIYTFKNVLELMVSQGNLIPINYLERERLCKKYKWSRFDAQAFTRGEHKRFKVS